MTDQEELIGMGSEVPLVEVLDRALGAGVVITGDITLSLADIDLVYVSLRLLVSSVGTLRAEEA
jgi:gas vesicle structural protein